LATTNWRKCRRFIDAQKSDLFDVLAYVAYAMPTLTREERAAQAKTIISNRFGTKQQLFLDFVLSHYVSIGVDELDQEKLTPLLRLKYHNSIADAVADLGDFEEIGKVFVGFQRFLLSRGCPHLTARSHLSDPVELKAALDITARIVVMAVMITDARPTTIDLAKEREKRLLRKLIWEDRRLDEDCMMHYPGLTAAKTIEMLVAFGGLNLTTAEAMKLIKVRRTLNPKRSKGEAVNR
jgi:EcoEI R protein C-terminal